MDRDLADLDGQFDTLVLGIGNLLWADEGFGVRCVEELDRFYRFPAHVRLMDGGTQGLYLVHYIQQAKNLLVFDAIDWGCRRARSRWCGVTRFRPLWAAAR
jgi:hydrogenase maturation protease